MYGGGGRIGKTNPEEGKVEVLTGGQGQPEGAGNLLQSPRGESRGRWTWQVPNLRVCV